MQRIKTRPELCQTTIRTNAHTTRLKREVFQEKPR